MSKTTFNDLFDFSFNVPHGFTLAVRLDELRGSAQRIADIANDKQIENGEFATLFASNIRQWLNEIAETADSALELHLEQNADPQGKVKL